MQIPARVRDAPPPFISEIGIQTLKQLITINTDPNGSLNTVLLQCTILQYFNTPYPKTRLSPAQCILDQPIKDFLPILPGHYKLYPT